MSTAQKPPLAGTMPAGLIAWLANGRRGMSSNTMVQHLVGIPAQSAPHPSHPHDPDDLDRCLQLLEDVPLLRVCLPIMATCSPEWCALIANWEQIEKSHLQEVGLHWKKAGSAPKTYALMRSVLHPARKEHA